MLSKSFQKNVTRHLRSCMPSASFSTQAQLAPMTKPTVELGNTKLLINGNHVDSISGKTLETIDPRTEQPITKISSAQSEDIDIAVASARDAFDNGPWPRMSGAERGKILFKLADLLEENCERIAQLETWDNGKPLVEARIDVGAAAAMIRWSAGWTDKISGKTLNMDNRFGEHFGYTLSEPMGVVGAITPWNFPIVMYSLKCTPPLAAGCTCVLKAAETTPLTALVFGDLCLEAGLPPGVVNVVPGFGNAGAALAGHRGIDKVTFTGETVTGRKVMAAAAENLKPVTLELGGKTPAIIFEDANLDNAIENISHGLFICAGQICVASSRVFVHESLYDEFAERVVAKAKARVVGDPFVDGVHQGPQQNDQQFHKVLEMIASAKQEGAEVLTGGNRFGDCGYFVEPTVFGNVGDDMRISREEIFGPCMQLYKFSDDDEVLRRANDTKYGLASSVWTQDIDRINYMTRGLKAGTVWVNTCTQLEAAAPLHGYKESGLKGEKGEQGLLSNLHTKMVYQRLPKNGGWY